MEAMRLSAVPLLRHDFLEMDKRVFRSSVAISPAKKSVTAITSYYESERVVAEFGKCEAASQFELPKFFFILFEIMTCNGKCY